MKKLLSAIIAFLFFTNAFSQNISKITITGTGSINAFTFGLDDYVKLNITKDGNISTWGYDRFEARGEENYNEKLDPYVGRVEYYSQDADAAFRGKIKFIGRVQLTYFASYENDAFKGKLKSIGYNTIEYYQSYDNEAYRGNIKSIGQQAITWYPSFENEGLRGKLKSIGNTELTYYSAYEDKAYKGKIKSIGGYRFTYYSSFELYSGSMKTGSSVQLVNAIKYYARNF